ncbi:MAG: hypothetical protein QXS93_00730 [Candidatus Micrarchaeia archaeon]
MRLQQYQNQNDYRSLNGFIGKNMFNKDFVMSLSHYIASKYFPKDGDLLFYDKEEAYSLAKRVCINALQRGISVNTLKEFAEKATTAEAFNMQVSRYFGLAVEENTRKRAYINLYRKEKEVLLKVFGLTEKDVEDLAWGVLSFSKTEQLYSQIEAYARLLDRRLSIYQNSRDIAVKFLSIRWGLDEGFPKPIKQVSCEMGLSDTTNHKIRKLMDEILEGLIEAARKRRKTL